MFSLPLAILSRIRLRRGPVRHFSFFIILFAGMCFLFLQGCRFSSSEPVNGEKVVLDKETGIMWQISPDSDRYPWNKAVKHCDELSYAGYTDWKLPSREELLTLVNADKWGRAPKNFGKLWTREEEIVTDPVEKAKLLDPQNLPATLDQHMRENPDLSFEEALSRAYIVSLPEGATDPYRKLGKYYALCLRKE